ncbi:hypothetical protein Sru01_13390 [Sphaerisporangium rufum]|uniref:DUF397 domain-containing protein n=1 Tax=Sphaerisporangium rufum TaxID=1381558 RepID=A0A919R3H4_9ACTN|nr:DUF397 domain-containing protein [Sphaerisporangium rufum]GII76357.1 hypothetical protein Sru01_13390 [Sphaerisporangium rufum]
MPSTAPLPARWRKSSYSGGNGGSCVEVARLGDGRIAIRDSKNIGPLLILNRIDWCTFLDGLGASGSA